MDLIKINEILFHILFKQQDILTIPYMPVTFALDVGVHLESIVYGYWKQMLHNRMTLHDNKGLKIFECTKRGSLCWNDLSINKIACCLL